MGSKPEGGGILCTYNGVKLYIQIILNKYFPEMNTLGMLKLLLTQDNYYFCVWDLPTHCRLSNIPSPYTVHDSNTLQSLKF